MFAGMNEHVPATRALDVVENLRRQQLSWVRAILEIKRWNPTRLARESGMSQSTLSKFLNDPSNMARLETNSVEKLRQVSPLPPYETKLATLPRGFAELEATSFDAADSDPYVAAAAAALTKGHNGLSTFTLQSRALETAGYLPGDALVVDLNARPRDGDAVLAHVHDRGGSAETVFRIIEGPYLVAASYARTLFKPLLVDGTQVVISGVVITSLRPRLSLLA
jgi:transcriptional regulator with XRE-family HTH domain